MPGSMKKWASRRASKRVKREHGIENPNAKQLKIHDKNDISRGTERICIPIFNEFSSETLKSPFNYISRNVVHRSAYADLSLAGIGIGDEDFCSDCVKDCVDHSCPCTRHTGGEFAYTQDGRLKPAFIQNENPLVFCSPGSICPKTGLKPNKCKGHIDVRIFVKECGYKCGCNMSCGNRVVQRGISRRLEVFFNNIGFGWGLRTAEDLPAGSFVCEYVGELMTNAEVNRRDQEAETKNQTHTSVGMVLDGNHDWGFECLDATRYGNVSRFIHHRCHDANLIDIQVSVEGLGLHSCHIALFTGRDVQAGEELTWDYNKYEDKHPIKTFQCLCTSEHCRGKHASATKKRTRKHKN